MLRGCFGNLIFAIIARMLCGNHLKINGRLLLRYSVVPVLQLTLSLSYTIIA